MSNSVSKRNGITVIYQQIQKNQIIHQNKLTGTNNMCWYLFLLY